MGLSQELGCNQPYQHLCVIFEMLFSSLSPFPSIYKSPNPQIPSLSLTPPFC